jgi:hypothetical protein
VGTILFLSATSLSLAQAVTPPGQVKKADPVAHARELETARTGMSRAQDLAHGNSVVATEQALVALNRTKPNSAAWHMETAQRIIQIVEQLSRSGKLASLPALADSALKHLTQAETLAKDARIKAAAQELAGFVHERFRGNREAALASYEAAVKLSPGSGRASEAAGRLKANGTKPVATPGGRGR